MKNYYLYILSGREYGPIFIEVTSDLKARMKSHKAGHLSQNAFRIDQLVHIEHFSNRKGAEDRMKALKTASREWVDALIERQNPYWYDLLTPANVETKKAA